MFRTHNNNSKVDLIEQKLIFFENLSKQMSIEFKTIIEKLSDGNAQVVKLVCQQDIRINTLDNTAVNITQEIKNISNLIETQNIEQRNVISGIHGDLKDINNKILELSKFKSIAVWTISALVAVLGILSSGGWLSPERFFNNPTQNSRVIK